MPDFNDSYAGPLHELRAASTAGGGTALTTTAARVQLPPGVNLLTLLPHTLATAAVVKIALCPYLVVFKTADDMATITDATADMQDASTATFLTLSLINPFSADDFVMIGSHVPFRGVAVDMGNANSTASVLTVKYWTGVAWSTKSGFADGTDSAGASLAQDGNVTWSVGTDWVKVALKDTDTPTPTVKHPYMAMPMYWTRWEWSVALDVSVTVLAMTAMPRSTAYAELISGQTFETRIHHGIGGISAVEALTDAGTASLIVNVGVRPNLPGVGLP
jgi:hypothetical protein